MVGIEQNIGIVEVYFYELNGTLEELLRVVMMKRLVLDACTR